MPNLLVRIFNPVKLLKGAEPEGELPESKGLMENTLQVAWPAIVESFLISLVSLIDTVMVSSLGAYAIAAVGLTTQPKFIGLAIFISLNVAVSAIVARRRGEGDREGANRVLKQALAIVLLLTVVVSSLSCFFAEELLHLAGSQPDTHSYAVHYFRIIMGAMGFNVISMVINAAQRGAGNTKIAMRTNLVSNGVNIVFNYLLIGGKFGFPALGVSGAAIATVIGTVFALGMSLLSVLHPDGYLYLFHEKGLRFDKRTLSAVANIGSSTLAEQIFLRIGFLIYSIIVANLGTRDFATHQIAMNVMNISFAFGDGLSVSAVALVGRSLGEKRGDLARIYGGVCQRLGVCFSCLLSVLFFFFGQNIYEMFTDDPAIISLGAIIMRLMCLIVFLQISQVIYSGCLRGAGDAKYVAFVSLISVALVRPGFGYLFCYPLSMGLIGAWVGLLLDQCVRFAMTTIRFNSGKWVNIKL